jgi:hypothetical protein
MSEGRGLLKSDRVIVWVSAGAASACAAKIASVKYARREVRYLYCDVSIDEHEDNQRFLVDLEQWIGRPIRRLRSKRYRTTDEVFEHKRFMSSPQGATCTAQLKKAPRFSYQWPDDVHIFGYTIDETMPGCRDPRRDRIAGFERDNPDLRTDWLLRDAGMTKADCQAMLDRAGIRPSIMYALGFKNANCKACVKATSPAYWQNTRHHFPEAFARRAAQSRKIGARLVRYKGERIFLDELPDERAGEITEDLSCGPQCASGDGGAS